MADNGSNLATITLRPQDIQTIVASLAANPDAMTTMVHLMSPPQTPLTTSSQENLPFSSVPSSASQATSSSSKLTSHFPFQLHVRYNSPLAHAEVKYGYSRDIS